MDEIERKRNAEANAFACEMLMPKESFIKAINDGCNTVEKLSAKFEVPCIAVKWNLERLNIVERGRFGYSWVNGFPRKD